MFGSNGPLWTLGIEWWLYMLVGFLLLYIPRKIKGRGLSVIHFVILFFLLLSPLSQLNQGHRSGCSLIFFLGAGTLFLCHILKVKFSRFLLLLGSIGMLIAACYYASYRDQYNNLHILMIGCSLFLLIAFTFGKETKLPKFIISIIRFFSGYSYSLFLIHYPILDLLAHMKTDIPPFIMFLIAILFSNVIAILFSFLFEKKAGLIASKIKGLFEKAKNK